MNLFKNIKEKGIKVKSLNRFLIVSIISLCLVMIYLNVCLSTQHKGYLNANEEYDSAVNVSQELQEELSRYSDSVKNYVLSGSAFHLEQYFKDKSGSKIDSLLEQLQALDEPNDHITRLRSEINNIEQTEYYILKLVVLSSKGQEMPGELEAYELPERDLNLTAEEMGNKARELLYGSTYFYRRNALDDVIEEETRQILEHKRSALMISTNKVEGYMRAQQSALIMTVSVILLVGVLLYKQVVVVLGELVAAVIGNKPMPDHGVYELRYLSKTYNEMTRKKDQKEKKLQNKAFHDPLTGVVNRAHFEQIVLQQVSDTRVDGGAFLLIDVDKFKGINDGHGHDVGDAILKRITFVLINSFRENDIVGRLGGDEFAMWMPGLTDEKAEYVQKRVEQINHKLMHPINGLPPVSLSVGIVFKAEGDDFLKMYKKADSVLYQVKENGRCGSGVYGL